MNERRWQKSLFMRDLSTSRVSNIISDLTELAAAKAATAATESVGFMRVRGGRRLLPWPSICQQDREVHSDSPSISRARSVAHFHSELIDATGAS